MLTTFSRGHILRDLITKWQVLSIFSGSLTTDVLQLEIHIVLDTNFEFSKQKSTLPVCHLAQDVFKKQWANYLTGCARNRVATF